MVDDPMTEKFGVSRGWLIFFAGCFLFVGIAENFRSFFMPLIKQELALNELELSGLIMIGAGASIIFQLSASALSDRMSHERMYHLALGCLTGSLFFGEHLHSYLRLLSFFFIFQAGITLYSMVSNTLIPTLGKNSGRLLTFCHGCYGLGAMLSPLIAEQLLKHLGTWQESYACLAYLALLIWGFITYLGSTQHLLPRLLPHSSYKIEPRNDLSTQLTHENTPQLKELLLQRTLWLFALLFGTAISAEVATSNWLIYYLRETQHLSQGEAAIYLSVFYALFTLGRFVGSMMIPSHSESKVLSIALSCSIILIILGVAIPSLSGSIFVLSGLTFALTFPMSVMSFNKVFTVHQTKIFGWVISVSLVIFMGVNALVGVWCTHLSVRTSYLLMAGCALIALVSHLLIEQEQQNQSTPNNNIA